jgi:chromosome segregation ATPase
MEPVTKQDLAEINHKLDGLTELMERMTRQEERNNSHSRRIENLEKGLSEVKAECASISSQLEKIVNRLWGVAFVLSLGFTLLQVFLK